MTKKIKDIIIGFCTAFLLCCAVGLTSFNVSALAYADEQVLTVEEYTSSDHLLKANGEESVKTIYDFSDEVKNAVAGAAFPELAEVIPAEYLESNIYNETFFYNGQEYGFYVVKEGMYFDVLLIDFKYDFDNGSQSDLEYKIRIEPILQQSFYRLETSNGEYNWYKYGGVDRYRYYVANPRFLSTIQNENALNYGDNGYSKQDDEGVIILQSRANYGKISYKTEKDLLGSVLEFTGDQIVGAVFGALDEVTGNVASVIKDSVEFAVTLYEEGKEVTVEANNERNISTRQSKTAQRMNEDIGGYSRVAAFMPTEEIVLSADINSYAEFITVLGDANYRSRLSEFCDFDIVRRNNDYASMQYVAGAGDNTDFSFKKISTLYDDQTITSLKSNTVTQQELAYFLKKGEHKFSYHCEDTTIYQFESNTQLSDISVYCNGIPVQVTELDSDTVEVLLEKGEDYEIIFSQENAGYYYFTFCKKASEINTLGTQAVQALTSGASAWFSYQSNQSKYLSISYDASKYNLEVCFVDNNGTNAYIDCNSVENQKEFFVQAGNKYYVWFSNKKTTNISSSTWEINEVETLPFNSTSDSFAVNGKRVFKFIAPVEGKYEIKGLPFGMSATMNAEYNGSYYLLSAGEYYVTVTGNTASTTCSIEFVSQQISLTALSPNTVSGGAKNVFIKFVPPVSLNYALVLPANISLEHIISENTILQTTDNSNMSLEANKTYYFRVVAVSGNLPAQFYLMIMPQITGVLDVNQATGNGSLSLNGSGEQVIKIGVTEINIYEFMGFENATLYNTYLQPIDMNSVLTAGTYYMTVNFNSGNVHNLQVYRKGKVMQIGDVIGVAGPGTYKYQLVKNNVYEIRIGASSDHTFTTNITLRDSLGTECVIDKEGEYYTFTATDTTMFMDLEMYNVAGQAGVLTLLEVNTTSGSIIQTIYPESLYPLAMDESKCIIKIPAGQYKLHVQKSLTDNIKLYEINGVYTNMRTGNPVNNSTGIEYLVSSTSERVYIIHSDNVEVTCLLSYNDGSEYKIEVQEESPQIMELSIYNNYEFVLYRYKNGVKSLVDDISSEDFYVFQGGTNGTLMTGQGGTYLIPQTDRVTAVINYFGIHAESTYMVATPEVEGEYHIATDGFYFKTMPLDYSSNEYSFKNVKLTLTSNNTVRFSSTYNYSTVSKDITEYVWDKNLSMLVEYTYFNSENESVVFSKVVSMNISSYNITGAFSFGAQSLVIVDASSFSGVSYSANKTITIPSTMKHIFFLGATNKKLYELDIYIESRMDTLTIHMKDFSYTFMENGLYVNGSSTLNLKIAGVCSIQPRNVTSLSGYGLYGYNINISGSGELNIGSGKKEGPVGNDNGYTPANMEGLPGIYAYNLTVGVNKLHAKGGAGANALNATGTEYSDDLKGKSGNPGGDGGYAVFAARINVMSACKTLILEGGNGGNGANGANGLNGTALYEAGGRGGHGGSGGLGGFYYYQSLNSSSISVPSGTSIQYIDGIRGNGGKGGNGGRGGPSGNGGNGGNGGDGYIGGIGGNGGAGGNGVDDSDLGTQPTAGGNGGHGGHGGYSYSTSQYVKPGNGGNGGHGGDPGGFGAGLSGGNGGYGYNGGRGGDGSDAHIVFAFGGNAGNGGDAYGGIAGSAGTAGLGLWNVNGSDGDAGTSYSSYQNYPWNT